MKEIQDYVSLKLSEDVIQKKAYFVPIPNSYPVPISHVKLWYSFQWLCRLLSAML